MRSIAALVFFLLFLSQHLQAQRAGKAVLRGTVLDAMTRQPVEAATVSVFGVADSSLVNYTLTNKKGEFLFRDLPQAVPYRIMVSYSGLGTCTRHIIITEGVREWQLPPILLKKSYDELDEIIVSARRPPFLFKNDTIEFDAGAFITPPNGLLEDLLKILPGLEVDDQGNITVNGKRISKITVDGKDFFGSDFKIASRNLPRDFIDRVQVMEYQPFEARFNKAMVSSDDKVINIVLKKDAKKGLFGRIGGGYGTDRRQEVGGSLNYMKGALQVNAIGNVNNVNKGGSTGTDFAVGKLDRNMETGGRGILDTKAGGLNFNNRFGKKWRVNGSYFYNRSHTTEAATLRRQNFLPDRVFFYNSTNSNSNVKSTHRTNLEIFYHPDSVTMLVVRMGYNRSTGRLTTENKAATSDAENQPQNTATNRFTSRPKNDGGQWELFIGRQLKKKGRAFTLRMNYNEANNWAVDSNKGKAFFYATGSPSAEERIDQVGTVSEGNKGINLSANFSEPVSKSVNMTLGYNYSRSDGRSDRTTHTFNSITGYHDIVDTPYTNALSNMLSTHVSSWTIAWNTAKVKANLGASVQWQQRGNESLQSKNTLKQDFTNLLPAVRVDYPFSKTGTLFVSYTGHSEQPTMEQLQPVVDNRNTLYIRLGNPGLRPAFVHIMEVNVQKQSSKGFWTVGLGGTLVQNQIVEDTWFDSIQVTRAVNANGNYSLTFNAGFNRNWKTRNWSLRWSAFNDGAYRRRVSFADKVPIITHTYNFWQRTTLTFTYKERITLMPYLIFRYQGSRFQGRESPSGEFITNTVTVRSLINWPGRWVWESNWQITRNNNGAPGFPKTVNLWHAAVNYQWGKNSQGTLRLAGFDLLRQNTSVNRFIDPTYIEDNQTMVLQRYFLLSVIYNLRQMK